MPQIRQIEIGERIECVYKHKSSKKKITIGNTYEVVKVRKYTNSRIKSSKLTFNSPKGILTFSGSTNNSIKQI